jgi:hypothetical protein
VTHKTQDVCAYILIAQPEDACVVARVADKAAFEESDIEDWGVEVDKLEDERFEGEIIIELSLGAVHLCDMTEQTGKWLTLD